MSDDPWGAVESDGKDGQVDPVGQDHVLLRADLRAR
jgi:hypothetical protein